MPAVRRGLSRFLCTIGILALDRRKTHAINRLLSGVAKTSAQAQIAQLVEQRIENPRVGGSNPPLGTINPLVHSGHIGYGS